MKPLTIDEVKKLKETDFVWIVYFSNPKQNTYVTKISFTKKMLCGLNYNYQWRNLNLDNYGRTWAIYRNKEEAEGRDGYTVQELVLELNKEHNAFLSECERSNGHRLKAGEFLRERNLLDTAIEFIINDAMSNTIPREELSCSRCQKANEVCISGDCTNHWKEYYLKQAEEHLKELKGE